MLSASLTACWPHHDTTKAACQSWKDVSFNSVVGHLYDGSSPSFKRLYDKIDDDQAVDSMGYIFEVQQLVDLCAQYGVKHADASMGMG